MPFDVTPISANIFHKVYYMIMNIVTFLKFNARHQKRQSSTCYENNLGSGCQLELMSNK